MQERSDGAPLTLLTHSAGGWLGRLYLLDYGTQQFDRMVSLGSPHNPPPEGVIDQTRGILTFCESACPGAHHDEVCAHFSFSKKGTTLCYLQTSVTGDQGAPPPPCLSMP